MSRALLPGPRARKPPPGAYFSETLADRAVRFIGALKHSQGEWMGRPFNLQPWQVGLVRDIFGTVRADGRRMYRKAYIELPRKTGKSELAAAIVDYLLFADGEPGAQIYSAAEDVEQAALVFTAAQYMVESNRTLARRAQIIESRRRILYPRLRAFYRVIASLAASKHGFSAHGVVYDELHVARNRKLYDVLTSSMGARRQPIAIGITTAGYDRTSLCWELHQHAEAVISGRSRDDTFYAYMAGAPEDADWTDPRVWRAANPNLGVTVTEEFLAGECILAQETPAFENTFRRLYLNQWTEADTRYFSMRLWDRCGVFPVDPEKLKGRRCWAGLDLAASEDIAALVLVFAPPAVAKGEDPTEPIQVLARFWCPEVTVRMKSLQGLPYSEWVKAGLMVATEGDVIDFDRIEHDIRELRKLYQIREIAFDRWQALQITQNLEKGGFTVVPFGQGFASMSAPTKELARLVKQGGIAHGKNPVLRWMAGNAFAATDAANNVKIVKPPDSNPAKVDGIVALVMGLDRALRGSGKRSVYETRGPRVLGAPPRK